MAAASAAHAAGAGAGENAALDGVPEETFSGSPPLVVVNGSDLLAADLGSMM